MLKCTFSIVERLQNIPSRLQNVIRWYLLTIMIETQKTSLTQAQEISGLHRSQFSRLLSDNRKIAENALLALASEVGQAESPSKKVLVTGIPWKIAVIIDSTLHPRSSLRVQNSQRLNHGAGFVIGHQWTNILIVIGDKRIPLPPIPFYSKNECKRRKIEYQTEQAVLLDYLKNLSLKEFIGEFLDEEVVVLTDAGYDNKKLQNAIIQKGWSFVCSLKNTRSCQTQHGHNSNPKKWAKVREMFWSTRKQAPWTTVRTKASGKKKRKDFRARRIDGYLKGVKKILAIVESEKVAGGGKRYLACSNPKLTTGQIARVYKLRWMIEQFHRETKDNLGMTDAGVHDFDSLVNHVHWVYVSHILIMTDPILKDLNLPDKQRKLRCDVNKEPLISAMAKIIKASTRFGGRNAVISLAKTAMGESTAA